MGTTVPATVSRARHRATVTVAEAVSAKTSIGETKAGQKLEPGGLHLWSFEAVAGDIVRVVGKSSSADVLVSIEYIPPAAKPGDEAAAPETDDAIVALPSTAKATGEAAALLRKTGTYQVTVSQRLCLATEYSLAIARGAKPWPTDQSLGASLKLGDTDCWTFEGERGKAEERAVDVPDLAPDDQREHHSDDQVGKVV